MKTIRILIFSLLMPFLIPGFAMDSFGSEQVNLYESIGGDFTLTGSDGKPVSLKDFRGRAVMIFFGFLNCPEVCPTTLLTMKKVRKNLGAFGDRFQVIFITLDPERDQPEMMGKFVKYFHPSFIGLTGKPEELKKVAKKYHVAFRKVKQDKGYFIAHSDVMYLLDQHGRTRGLYQRNDPVEKMVKDINSLFASL